MAEVIPLLKAKVIRDIATEDECLLLVDYAKKITNWDPSGHPFWDRRVINTLTISRDNLRLAMLMSNIRERMRQKIKKVYDLDNEIYPDLLQLVRWPEGTSQPPHSDAYNIDGSPHVSPWREYGSVVYLNDDYEGGQTYYSNFDFEVQPVAGTLAVHPADLLHYHGVREVKGTTRYTLVSFWSTNRTHYDDLSTLGALND